MIVVLAGIAAPRPEARAEEPAGESGATSVLTSKNLTRSGVKFVFEEDEKDVQDKLKAAKESLGQYQTAVGNQFKGQAIQAQLSELAMQKSATQQMINQLNMQARSNSMTGLRGGGAGLRGMQGRMYQQQGAYNMLLQQRQLLTNLGQQESMLKGQLPSEKQRAELNAEVDRQKTELTDRLKDLQTAIDSAEEKYREAAKDDEIRGALADLGRAAKVNFKLGPSEKLLAAAKFLKAANQAMNVTPAKASKSAAKKKKTSR